MLLADKSQQLSSLQLRAMAAAAKDEGESRFPEKSCMSLQAQVGCMCSSDLSAPGGTWHISKTRPPGNIRH